MQFCLERSERSTNQLEWRMRHIKQSANYVSSKQEQEQMYTLLRLTEFSSSNRRMLLVESLMLPPPQKKKKQGHAYVEFTISKDGDGK